MKKRKKRNFLQYCTICQQAWEYSTMDKKEIKHQEMPSFGLARKECSRCKEPPKSFKDLPSTLARERHKILLQKIATDNQKLLKKNVGKQRTK